MLERGKKYLLSSIAICMLILKSQHTQGIWYIRLAINLKHLRQKRLAFELISLCPFDLVKCFERNTLLKVRLQLFSEICRSEHKLEMKSQKKAGKAGRPRKMKQIGDELQIEKCLPTTRPKRLRDIEMFLDSESSGGGANNLADFDDQNYLAAMDSDSEE